MNMNALLVEFRCFKSSVCGIFFKIFLIAVHSVFNPKSVVFARFLDFYRSFSPRLAVFKKSYQYYPDYDTRDLGLYLLWHMLLPSPCFSPECSFFAQKMISTEI